VTDLDISPHALESARRNFELNAADTRMAAARYNSVQADAFAWVSQTAERFDLVLLDPPFGEGVLDRIVPRLAGVLAPGAALYVESDAPVDIDTAPWTQLPGVRVHRADRAGLVHYHLLLMPAEPTGA
jgi:16S rRNA G966 N2-methylase RsmD